MECVMIIDAATAGDKPDALLEDVGNRSGEGNQLKNLLFPIPLK